jgi:hypothetical protein
LLSELVDYAGLFPPAALSMSDAVAEFAAQHDAPEAWALGRFVAPAARLDELATEARDTKASPSLWRVSALLGDAAGRDIAGVRAFNRTHVGRLLVDTVECRALNAATIAGLVRDAAPDLSVFFELSIDQDPTALLTAVRDHGARAKVRTGGVTSDAFPSTAKLARFIARCAQLGVPFKATAGLHHPLRGEQRLTYAGDSPCATMFGFLNVFVAAAMARAGMDEVGIARVLEERDPDAFEFGDTALRWRDHALSLDELVATRGSFALSFGSCSFREPIDDLRRLALL